MNKMVLKTERVTVIATTTFEAPYWMQLAFEGSKIPAIKALRDLTPRDHNGDLLGLRQAKEIVESVTNGIRTASTQV